MSSAGRAANSSGCVARPKEHATGLIGFAAQIRRSSLIGSCAMEAAEHREPCESRGSCMDLGAPGGEIPPGDSTIATVAAHLGKVRTCPSSGHGLSPPSFLDEPPPFAMLATTVDDQEPQLLTQEIARDTVATIEDALAVIRQAIEKV